MNANPERRHLWTSAFRPIAGVLLVLCAFYAFLAYRLVQSTQGHLVYALDDAYIHMAIAKNLALYGNWGVQPGTFSASSSSPLWTLLLAATFRVAGVWDAAPLVLNTVLAAACVVTVGMMLRSEQLTAFPVFAVALSTTLLAPLVPLVWTGMEHTLHILLTVLVAWQVIMVVRSDSPRRLLTLCIVAALMVAARYEGLFVVAGCSCALALQRRAGAAATLALAGALPLIAVGGWNISHGWFFLPASILMKQSVLGAPLLSSVFGNLTSAQVPAAFAALFAGAVVVVAYQIRSSGMRSVHPLLVVFLVAAALHTLLAKFGYLWRYESYLMVLGAIAIAIASAQATGTSRRAHEMVAAISLAVVFIFGSRTLASSAVVANTAGHIYRQQYQVARFIKQHYDRQPIAVNDIGNVSYYTQAHVFDLIGLGSIDIARLRRSGEWDASHVNELLRRDHTAIAVIYDSWFSGARAFQSDWVKVGRWVTDDGGDSEGAVTFYAADTKAAETLRSSLGAFDKALPPAVVSTRTDDLQTSNR